MSRIVEGICTRACTSVLNTNINQKNILDSITLHSSSDGDALHPLFDLLDWRSVHLALHAYKVDNVAL